MGIWDGGTALYLSEEMFHRIPKINQEWWHIPLKPAFGRQGQANQLGLHNKTLSLKENKVVYSQLHVFMKILY